MPSQWHHVGRLTSAEWPMLLAPCPVSLGGVHDSRHDVVDPTLRQRQSSRPWRCPPLDEPIRMIRDGLGFDCAALVGPPRVTLENSHPPVLVNLDYPSETLRFIATTYATQCPAHRYAVERRAALRFIDLPYDFRQSRTYREALKPCGFNEGLTLPPSTPPRGGTVPGFLA